MCNKTVIRCILVFSLSPLCLPVIFGAELDSVQTVFLDSIESVLRSDYRRCTEDSSNISLKQLFAWRKSIDSLISCYDYALIAKKFREETGLSPVNVRPCEIIEWLRHFEQQLKEYGDLLNDTRTRILKHRDDSLFLTSELNRVKHNTYDFRQIPFGLTRRGFLLLSGRIALVNFSDQGSFVRFDSLLYGVYPFKFAFHFAKDTTYNCYEIESASCSVDSLELWARPMMLYLAEQFEKQTGSEPDHIYRIGFFDIVPGRLAVGRLWNFADADAYIGLARLGNRFYAKAVISKKP